MEIDPLFRGIIRPLSEEEYSGLEASILHEGCRDALIIATWPEEGEIKQALADGHHRYEICTKYGMSFETTVIDFESKDDAIVWICDNQLGRRNLTPFNRTELALIKEPIIARKAKERQRAAGGDKKSENRDTSLCQISDKAIDTKKEVAKAAGVSHDTVIKVKKIKEAAPPEVQEQLRRGDPETSINKVYNDIRREEKRAALQASNDLLSPPSTHDGRYKTIVIDPPWDMKKIDRDVRPNQVGFDYPTMTLDEIKSFPICDMVEEASHLYLWTTQKYLPHAFEVLKEWGFKYVFTMTWHKPGGFQPVGLPQYNSEFVVFGRRGGLEFIDTKAFPTCFNAPRREHSRKPDEFYDLVRRVSPGPRIDVFSREKRDGFDQYGNETGRFE